MTGPFSLEPTTTEQLPVTETEGIILSSLDNLAQRKLAAQANAIETDTELKKRLAKKTFKFMVKFANFVAALLVVYFLHIILKGSEIPKEVIIALLTTALATVVGLVAFILKGLFNSKD